MKPTVPASSYRPPAMPPKFAPSIIEISAMKGIFLGLMGPATRATGLISHEEHGDATST
jgi:hypothetical protein